MRQINSTKEIIYSKDYPIVATYNNGVKIAVRKADDLYIRVDYYTVQKISDIYFVLDSADNVILTNERNQPTLMSYREHDLYVVEALGDNEGRVMLDRNGNTVKLPFNSGIYYHQTQDCFMIYRHFANKPTQVYVFDGALNFKKIEARRGSLVVDNAHMMVKKEYLEFRNVEFKYENGVEKKLFKTTNYMAKVANDWIEHYRYDRNTHDVEFVKESFVEKRFVERV